MYHNNVGQKIITTQLSVLITDVVCDTVINVEIVLIVAVKEKF